MLMTSHWMRYGARQEPMLSNKLDWQLCIEEAWWTDWKCGSICKSQPSMIMSFRECWLLAHGMKTLPPVFTSKNLYTHLVRIVVIFFKAAIGLERGEASVCFDLYQATWLCNIMNIIFNWSCRKQRSIWSFAFCCLSVSFQTVLYFIYQLAAQFIGFYDE